MKKILILLVFCFLHLFANNFDYSTILQNPQNGRYFQSNGTLYTSGYLWAGNKSTHPTIFAELGDVNGYFINFVDCGDTGGDGDYCYMEQYYTVRVCANGDIYDNGECIPPQPECTDDDLQIQAPGPGWIAANSDPGSLQGCKDLANASGYIDGYYTTYPANCAHDQANLCFLKLPCSATQNYNTTTQVCDDCGSGQLSDGNGTCCDAGTADSFYNVDQTTCQSSSSLYVDGLSYYTNINWNSCLNKCVATSNSCPKNKVFNQQGYCVDPTLDPTDCEAAGGTLQNFTYTQTDTCFPSSGVDVISPCCTYQAQCIKPDGTIISTPYTYVSCQDQNDTQDINMSNDNQCSSCPSQYPYPNSAGNCENSNGDILMCPTVDYNNTTPTLICGTCSILSGGWTPDDSGMCKHTTVNGIVQFAACPSDTTSNTTDPTTPGGSTPDANSTFDNNSTLGDGQHTQSVCNTCPSGYKSIAGSCGIVSSTGQILSFIPCPTPPGTIDTNGTDPLADQNGTEDNATGNLDQFGNSISGEIKKAYKSYTIFNTTDCGELQVSADVHLFNQPNAVIKDPIPMFRDIMAPYRNIIKGFLIFIAGIIGLFDFFRRS